MKLRVVLLLLLGMSWSVSAERVTGLYKQSEPVSSQEQAERQRAMKAAVAKVLVRVSGHSRVLEALQGQSILTQPARYVESWRYQRQPNSESDGYQLQLSFSQAAVEAVLRRHRLPIWSESRPNALLWLVRDDWQAGREIVSLQEETELAEGVIDLARERGLPLVTPLMDLEDRVALSANQLWRQDHEAILQASLRYDADSIVIARYSQTSTGRWLAAWTVWHKDQREVMDLEANSESDAVLNGVSALADYMADQYALVLEEDAGVNVTMTIEGIESFADFTGVLSYLDSLDVIGEATPGLFEGSQLQVSLTLASSVDALLDSLALGGRLNRMASPAVYGERQDREAMTLMYQWSKARGR